MARISHSLEIIQKLCDTIETCSKDYDELNTKYDRMAFYAKMLEKENQRLHTKINHLLTHIETLLPTIKGEQ